MTLPIKTKTSVLKVLIHIITSIVAPPITHIITSIVAPPITHIITSIVAPPITHIITNIVAPPITHTVILVIMFVSTFKTCRYSIFKRQAGYEILS